MNKSVILIGRSDNDNEPSPFQVQHSQFQPKKGYELILKIKCFSLDPVMRVWMTGAQTYYPKAHLNQHFHTFGVGQVIQSKNNRFKKGDLVFGNTSCSQFISVGDEPRLQTLMYIPQDLITGFTPQQFTYLTNNGLTAFEGIDLMNVKSGQTVIISTAAGATGLIACQILKYRGIKVIGLTSSKKVDFVSKFCDITVNYQNKQELKNVLKNNSFKYYFDNVGQWLLDLILLYIEPFGVISLCGATSNYRSYKQREGIKNYSLVITKRLSLKGFNFSMAMMKIFQAFDFFREMRKKNKLELVIQKIKIEDFPENFKKLMTGKNIGKIIVSNQPQSKL